MGHFHPGNIHEHRINHQRKRLDGLAQVSASFVSDPHWPTTHSDVRRASMPIGPAWCRACELAGELFTLKAEFSLRSDVSTASAMSLNATCR